MDLGLGSLVAKFEEYFGRRATGALLILAYASIATGGISLIWTQLLRPALVAAAPLLPTALTLASSLNIIGIAVTIIGAMSAGSFALDAYRRRLAVEQLENLVPRARELTDDAGDLLGKLDKDKLELREMLDQVTAKKNEAEELLALTAMVVADILDEAVSSGFMTQAQADVMRALSPLNVLASKATAQLAPPGASLDDAGGTGKRAGGELD